MAQSPKELLATLQDTFHEGVTRDLSWRRSQLRALRAFLLHHEDEILGALHQDLGKPAIEGWIADIALIRAEIDNLLRHLATWSRPRRVSLPLAQIPGRGYVVPEPFGVALVISPWNYPLNLALVPLASAIAAGNACVVKPSELAPATSALLARYLPQVLDSRAIGVVEGGAQETGELLALPFDFIFFTGSGRVGKIVMKAAAENLTPVVLELGGKSPAIVDKDSATEITARRIAVGKFLNAGQTCIAPDYVLVHKDVAKKFTEQLREVLNDFYGTDPKSSPDFARIVNDHHFTRLESLLKETKGSIVVGGETDRDSRYVAPSVIATVDAQDPLMQEEIFGPLLPVLVVDDVESALRFVGARPTPLALYFFSGSRRVIEKVRARVRAGGIGINTAVLQYTIPNLPFGGLGPSGMGNYHGKAGFDAFTHQKSVLQKPRRFDPPVLYPPYRTWKSAILRKVL
jgi:aldehyde dehydrogenase (NAD+)